MQMTKGKVFDIQRYSVQDGPGVRTTVFFKGCPLRCPWCHSPESQEYFEQLCWISMRCAGLESCKNRCINMCTENALHPGKTVENPLSGENMRLVAVDREKCTNCGKCAEVCYCEALYICGQDYTADQIIKIALRDKKYYDQSGGGVTLSGGECLSQPDFALELLKALKENNIHTAVDTTGFVQQHVIDSVLPYTDLFLYDLKHIDSDIHKTVTGVPNEIILQNAEHIAVSGGKMQIRIPVIPMFNDDNDTIDRIGEFCCKLGKAVTSIQLLPYHAMGSAKYQRLKENAVVFEAIPPSDTKMEQLKSRLENMGLCASIH